MDAKILPTRWGPFGRRRRLMRRVLPDRLFAARAWGRLRKTCWPLIAVTVAVSIATATATADVHAASSPLSIKAIAEIELSSTQDGRTVTRLAPAERVVPGDRLIYTLEVRNVSAAVVAAPIITHAIPQHMQYVADSAVGPGARVSYSVDGGRSFDDAENLKVRGVGGLRPAVAADYTHIRWQLKNNLKANSVAFVRFRTLVK